MDLRRLVNEGPTVVGMLTTVIGSGGSLDTAARAVASDGPEISAGLFSEAVRLADTKGCDGVSAGIKGMAGGLHPSLSGYKHALLLCVAAAESGGHSERDRLLREASEIALDSVRAMGETYSGSLTVPCMTVFGLGIMLPMILMSLVPMLGIGGMFGSDAVDGGAIVLVTVVLIPAAILALTVWIRRSNPFLSPPPVPDGPASALPLLLAVPLAAVQVWLGSGFETVVLLSVGPAALVTAVLMAGARRAERVRRECEQGLRDSVFELGNRMLSGESFETVCAEAVGGRPECEGVRRDLERELALCRGDVPAAIGRSVGAVSKEASGALCDIYRCSGTDTEDAGRLAIALGRQFHNSDSVRRSLELRLKSMTDMMQGTAVLFAPMVLGMSVSMLEPLTGMAGYEPADNGAALTVYLVELCALIALLTSSLGSGGGIRTGLWRFCVMTPVALTVFALCSGTGL